MSGTALHYPSTAHPQSFLSSSYPAARTRGGPDRGSEPVQRAPHDDSRRDSITVSSSVYGEFIYLDDSTVTSEGGGSKGGGGSVSRRVERTSLGRLTSLASTPGTMAASPAAWLYHPSANDPNDDRVIFLDDDDDDSEVLVLDPKGPPPPPVEAAASPMITQEDDEIIFLDGASNSMPHGQRPPSTSDCELGNKVVPPAADKDPQIPHDDNGEDECDGDDAADPVISSSGNARPWFQTDANRHWFIWEFLQFQKTRSWKKKLLTIVVMLSSIYVIVDLIFLGNVQQWINASLRWMTAHPFPASVAFFGLFVVTSLMFVPITPLVFASGFCFVSVCGGSMVVGAAVALVLSFVSLVAGAILSFLRARYMSQDIVRLFATRYPIVKAADRALQRKGFKIMLLLRLCPIIPFNGLNYIGGVTSVSLSHFTYSLVGMLPTVVLWVLVGATSKSLAQTSINDQTLQVYMGVLLGVGLWVAVLALFITWKVASKELRKEIESNSAETWFRYRDDSQAPSHAGDGDDDEGGDDEDNTGVASGTGDSSSHFTGGVDPLALSALNASNDGAERPAPRSPEYERAAGRLPRPPLTHYVSPLLPPRLRLPGVFDDLDGVHRENDDDDDDEIIFVPHPGPYGSEVDEVHDEYRDVEHPFHDEYDRDDYHPDDYHPDDHYHPENDHDDHHPSRPHSGHPHYSYLSHNWLLSQLGIGYGMDTYDPYGDPRGRDTDPLWLWA